MTLTSLRFEDPPDFWMLGDVIKTNVPKSSSRQLSYIVILHVI